MLFNQNPRHQRGGLPSAFGGLATLLALGGAVFVAPALFPVFEGMLWNSLIELYSHDVGIWLFWGAKWGTYPLCFFALRMAITAAFMSLMLFVAKRLI